MGRRFGQLRRGDVYTVRFDPVEGSEQAGTRPALIVSRDIMNLSASTVIVVPITSFRGKRQLPSHVFLASGAGGLANDSIALAEQIRLVSKSRLGRHWGALSPATMARIDDALRSALSLDGPNLNLR